MMSPAIRRELADVRSIRTATSSQESEVGEVTEEVSVPPNHHTLRLVSVLLLWCLLLWNVEW